MIKTSDLGKYYKISPDTRDLNYNQYFSKGSEISIKEEYNSSNTKQLNIEEMKSMLIDLPMIKQDLNID